MDQWKGLVERVTGRRRRPEHRTPRCRVAAAAALWERLAADAFLSSPFRRLRGQKRCQKV